MKSSFESKRAPQRERRSAGARLAGGINSSVEAKRAPQPRDTPQRLQKALAEAGLGSRRMLEEWIRAGRVRVNGQVAQLGLRVTTADRVNVDGAPVRLRSPRLERTQVLVYHKPEGEVVSRRDPERRPTIFQRLPGLRTGRWITVGRLDLNTAGLLLVTNDGTLAHRLMHPAQAIEREYLVRIHGTIGPESLRRLRAGVTLEDGPARFEQLIEVGGSDAHRWFRVVLREGRHRETRRLWEAVGCQVSRLKRIRFGNVALGPRPLPGQWRPASAEECADLFALAGLPAPAADTAPRRGPGVPRPARRDR